MDEYTSEKARKEWRRILNEVERGEPVAVTRYGKRLAVVVPAEWFDRLAALKAVEEGGRR
jgi:prevent-host-death family protein